MNPPIAFVAALLGSGGCVTTHHMTRPPTLEVLQGLVQMRSEPVAVLYRTPAKGPPSQPSRLDTFYNPPPPTLQSDFPFIDGDGVWVAPPGGPLLLRLADVQGLEVKRRGLGAFEGWAIGMLGGAALGALVGYSQGDDPPCMRAFPDCLFYIRASAGDKAVIGGVAGGLSGGLTGLLVGWIVGRTDRYLF